MDQISIVREESVQLWKDSGDPFLMAFAEDWIGQPFPEEKFLVGILTFFSIFNIGCNEMGLSEVAEKFQRRINLFLVGLEKIGYSRETRREHVAKRNVPGIYHRITKAAFGRVAYTMCDLSRNLQKYDLTKEKKN